ncbi:S-adenosyl-L-methionine-dependent methyltransferase [Backusella circina FSU 941]|nr:S-adenosyl-L-methionine-dependent methyltransferase [Backusella circina FSU 941]
MGGKQSRHHHTVRPEKRNSVSTTSKTQSSASVIIEGRAYHNIQTSTYCLPRDELEQDRLNSQHFSLKALFSGNILPTVSALLPSNAKILDIGCGSGSWVMEMAIDHPGCQVTGVDMSDMFPTTIRPENVKFELLNVLDGLPYADNSFDFVHMRLMIAALRSTEWPLVLTEIRRVLKPGGLLQLVESDFTAIHKALQERGQDPWIASKLGSLLNELNFDVKDRQMQNIEYGNLSNPVSKEMIGNWKVAMLSFKPLLASKLVENPDHYHQLVDRYLQGCIHGDWVIKISAYCAQKPFSSQEN